jgi:hypothetical protein
MTFQDDQKSAALGDPEPLSATAKPPGEPKQKRHLVDNSPATNPYLDPDVKPPKIGPPPPADDKPKKPRNLKPPPDPDPQILSLELRRSLMGLDLKKYGDPGLAKIMQEIEQQKNERSEIIQQVRKMEPKVKGRYPKQHEQRPEGGQKWGSRCTKQKPNLDLLKCLVCEYYAAACKGYPGAFVMIPKILEHAMPRLSVRAKTVLLAILFTVRSFSLRSKNFGISFASNKEISKLSGVPAKHLSRYYKELEQENIIRKQTDSARHTTGPKKGTWKNKRNFFDISIIFKPFISVKDLEREIKHCAQYEKMQKRRAFVAENRRKSNRQIN